VLEESPAEAAWHADRRLTAVKFALVVVFAGVPWLIGTTATGRLLGLIVAAGMLVWAARDLAAPVRLRADSAGVTLTSGFAGTRRLAWSEIERVRLDGRSRYGARTELLEIDAGESLYFFSRYDLSVPPAEALEMIEAIRPA
jgi:hypothetical protein